MSLSKRLRDAAIARALDKGHVVDSFILSSDGVIDLRSPESPETEFAASRPSPALRLTLGGFRAEIEIDQLYHDDEPRTGWKRLRRSD